MSKYAHPSLGVVFAARTGSTNGTTLQRSLESFFGIGPKVSQRIMAKFHIHPWQKVGALKNSTVLELTEELTHMKIENDLRRQVQEDIRRLRDMGTYRGRRHAMGLPVRGQRTRTQVCGGVAEREGWAGSANDGVDHDSAEIEQDGAWWYGQSGHVDTRMPRGDGGCWRRSGYGRGLVAVPYGEGMPDALRSVCIVYLPGRQIAKPR